MLLWAKPELISPFSWPSYMASWGVACLPTVTPPFRCLVWAPGLRLWKLPGTRDSEAPLDTVMHQNHYWLSFQVNWCGWSTPSINRSQVDMLLGHKWKGWRGCCCSLYFFFLVSRMNLAMWLTCPMPLPLPLPTPWAWQDSDPGRKKRGGNGCHLQGFCGWKMLLFFGFIEQGR